MLATVAGLASHSQVLPPWGHGLVPMPRRWLYHSKLPASWASGANDIAPGQQGPTGRADRPAGAARDGPSDGEDCFSPWGDRLGDKPEDTFRIYCHNVNGLSLQGDGGDLAEMCEVMRSKGVDVCGVVEHNLDQTQRTVLSTCHEATRRVLRRAKLTVAGTNITMAGQYKPGGVLQISAGRSLGRIQSTAADSMGRWTAHSFRGQQGKQFTVVTVYQVCKATWSLLGRYTAAAQQISMLRAARKRSLDPRVHFRLDLEEFLRALVVAGHSVLVQGDFNETLDAPDSGVGAVASRMGLVDVMRSRHPTLPDPATYVRGSSRLDFVLATPDVAAAVTAAGYESPFRYLHSDHRPVWVDLDAAALFGAEPREIPDFEGRPLKLANRVRVEAYLRRKDALFQKRNMYERISRLAASGVPDEEEAEKIDRDLAHLTLSAERKLPSFRAPAWSVALFQARTKLAIHKLRLTELRLRRSVTNRIRELQQSLLEPVVLAATVGEAKQAVAAARRLLHTVLDNADDIRKQEQDA